MPSIRFTAVALAVLCFIAIPVSSLSLREGPAHPEAATIWVDKNAGFLPSNYGAFSEFSLTYRKAIYAKLDSKIQAQLWTDHWESYRISHPDLTAAQKKVLDILTAYVDNPTTEWKEIDFEALLKPVFNKEERRIILTVLGPDEESPVETKGAQYNRRAVAVAICQCSTSADYCIGSTCKAGGCTYQTSGCGHLWTYSCNGLCHGGSDVSSGSTQTSTSFAGGTYLLSSTATSYGATSYPPSATPTQTYY